MVTRIVPFIIFIAWILPVTSLAESYVGRLEGGFSFDRSGSANYTVPIDVPPGINGLQPEISLRYSSSVGNGPLGVGWRLNAGSTIYRCPSNKIDHARIDPVDYDHLDKFCFNGRRMVLFSGEHGRDGAIYRFENLENTKLIARGEFLTSSDPDNPAYSPRYWEVVYNNGLISYYGADQYGLSLDSIYDPRNEASPYSWDVKQTVDRFGNSVQYFYEKNVKAGLHRLSRIEYQEYAIEMVWDETYRSDAMSGFYAIEAPYKVDYKLDKINVISGRNITFWFELNYGWLGRKVVLEKISKCTDSESCVETKFRHKGGVQGFGRVLSLNDGLHFSSSNEKSESSDMGSRLADINGDGLTDVIQLFFDGRNQYDSDSNAIKRVMINTGEGFQYDSVYSNSLPDVYFSGTDRNAQNTDRGARLSDVNGDGLVDLIVLFSKYIGDYDYEYTTEVLLNTGSQFIRDDFYSDNLPEGMYFSGIARSGYAYDGGTRLADINGDGLVDLIELVVYEQYAGGTIGDIFQGVDQRVYVNNGKRFVRDWNYSDSVDDEPLYFSGLGTDINSFDLGTRLIDINGDGLVDLVRMFEPKPGHFGETTAKYVYLNTGYRFEKDEILSDSLPDAFFSKTIGNYKNSFDMGTRVEDINGDGLADLIQLAHILDEVKQDVYINQGSKFVRSASYSNSLPNMRFSMVEEGGKSFDPGTRLADINGDGLVDLIQFYKVDNGHYGGVSQRRIWINTGTQFVEDRDLITSVPVRFFSGTSGDKSYDMGARLADMDGDGLVDLITKYAPFNGDYGNDKIREIVLNSRVDQSIEYVENSIGPSYRFTYDYLPQMDEYTHVHLPESYPLNVTVAPMKVLTKMEMSNGVGGMNAISYEYAIHLVNVNGFGQLGFKSITSVDETSGIKTKTTYSHDWKKRSVGMIEARNVWTSDGIRLEQTVNLIEDRFAGLYSNRFHLPYVTVSQRADRDIDGSPLGVTHTENFLDQKGWLIEEITCVTPGSDYDLDFPIIARCNQYASTELTTRITNIYYDEDYAPDFAPLIKEKITSATPEVKPPFQLATQRRGFLFDYYLDTGKVKTKVSEPYNINLIQTTSYDYNLTTGQVAEIEISGANITPRKERFEYNQLGQLWKHYNAYNHITEYRYENNQYPWLKTATIYPNGIQESISYDSFGIKASETRHSNVIGNENISVLTERFWCNPYSCDDGKYYILSTPTVGFANYIYYDELGREVSRKSLQPRELGDSSNLLEYVVNRTEYDLRGNKIKTSIPHYESEAEMWRETRYDLLNRPVEHIDALSNVKRTEYSGYTIVHTDSRGHRKTLVHDSLGQLVESRDHLENSTRYRYNGFGELVYMVDPKGNETKIGFNRIGQKTKLDDPDMGVTHYSYDVLGNLLRSEDPNSEVITYEYDLLNRLVLRSDSHGTSEWFYDLGTGAENSIGKLSRVETINTKTSSRFSEVYTYDNDSRLTDSKTTIDGTELSKKYDYDNLGRPTQTTYPNGLSVINDYFSGDGRIIGQTTAVPQFRNKKGLEIIGLV